MAGRGSLRGRDSCWTALQLGQQALEIKGDTTVRARALSHQVANLLAAPELLEDLNLPGLLESTEEGLVGGT